MIFGFRKFRRLLFFIPGAYLLYAIVFRQTIDSRFEIYRGVQLYREIVAQQEEKCGPDDPSKCRQPDEIFIPILMPICKRPEFTRTVLEALRQVSGVDRTILITSDDCPDPEMAKLLQEDFPFPVIRLSHTRPFMSLPSLFGSNEFATASNLFFLLSFAFDAIEAPAAIVLESDILPSKDMFDFFQWAFKHFMVPGSALPGKWRNRILSINAYNPASVEGSHPYTIQPSQFMPRGWLTSRQVWHRFLREGWTFFNNWDHVVQETIRKPNNLICVAPSLSRSRHIGYQGENYHVEKEESHVYLEEKLKIAYARKKPMLKDFNDEFVATIGR